MSWRSSKYLNHVRKEPCCICLKPGPSDAHHFAGRKGMAVKQDDTMTVPLCRVHHNEWHSRRACGGMSSQETSEVFWRTAARLLALYVQAKEEMT